MVAIALASSHSPAQGDAAAAEQLYKQGKALAKKGDYAAACPKFEASYGLDRGLGALLNLADCHERLGKLASAWAEWNEAHDLAKRSKDDRAKYAGDRRDKIEPKLPKLQINVKNPVDSLAVYRGDAQIEAATYGAALAVDPGEVLVSVRRGDQTLKSETVTAKEAQTATVELDLAAIDAEFPAPKPAPTATATATATAPPPPAPRAPPPSGSQKTIGYVVGGVGVAALLTAGVLEGLALSKKSKADEPDQCVNGYCSPNGFQTIEDAKRLATIGQWVGIGGVLFTAVGATLVLTAPSSQETARAKRPARLSAGGWIAPSGGGIALSGSL
jgi:tetratricopeptide (TPR) repeat protein